MKKTGQRRAEDEICRLRNQHQSHVRESEARFASLKYDVTSLATKFNRVTCQSNRPFNKYYIERGLLFLLLIYCSKITRG